MAVIQAIRSALNLDTPALDKLPAKWPITTKDENRIRDYATYRSIFDGEHALALDEQDIAGRYGQYIAVNLPRIIVTIPADFLFGEEFELTYDDDADKTAQEACDEILTRSDDLIRQGDESRTLFYETKLDSGIDGEVVITVNRNDKGKAYFQSQPVETWCPEFNPDNKRQVIAHWFGWKRTAIVDKKEKDFLRLIKHEKGTIRNYVVGIKPDGSLEPDNEEGWNALYPPGTTKPEKVITTGLEDFALEHIPNWRTAKEYHGRAEVKDIDGMIASLNARITQSDQVMARHSDPILGLPADVYASLTKDGKIDKSMLDVVRQGENQEKPEYVVWDGKLADNLTYIDKLVNLIALVSETAPQLLNQGEWGGDLSGKALKILLIRTLAKVNRSRLYYSVAIPNLLVKAQIIEGVASPVRPTVKWPDGLPQDIMEAIEVAERKLSARIETRAGALAMVDDISEDAAKKKIEEVDGEEDVDRNNDIAAQRALGVTRKNPIAVNFGDGN